MKEPAGKCMRRQIRLGSKKAPFPALDGISLINKKIARVFVADKKWNELISSITIRELKGLCTLVHNMFTKLYLIVEVSFTSSNYIIDKPQNIEGAMQIFKWDAVEAI